MYLGARVFGIFTYVYALGFFFLMIKYVNLSVKRALILYAIVLATMGYFFVPPNGHDLSRLIPIMHQFGRMSLDRLWKMMLSYGAPLLPLYYYVLAQFHSDNILGGMSTLITFMCIFSVVWRFNKDYGITKEVTALSVFWILASGVFGQTIDGIRTMMSFSIIVAGFYSEIFRNRRFLVILPLYLCGAFLHSAGIVFLGIRVSFLVFQKTDRLLFKIGRLILVALVFAVGAVVLSSQITRAYAKAINYLTRNTYSYIWNEIIGTIDAVVVIYLCCILKKNADTWEDTVFRGKIVNHANFVLVIASICLISLPFEYSIFSRFMYGATMMTAPIIMALLSNEKLPPKVTKNIYNLLLITGVIMTALSVSRGEICSLKYWE